MRAKVQSSGIAFLLLAFLGCGQESPPTMLSPKYGTVLVGENTVLHEGGNLKLYRFSASGQRQLVWPALIIRKEALFEDLILFNGKASGERSWIYYPALFGFAGTGSVVELSQAIARLNIAPLSGGTNYSFSVASISNNAINLSASQRPPIDMTKPITVSVRTTKEEVLSLISEAHTNGSQKRYAGVSYLTVK